MFANLLLSVGFPCFCSIATRIASFTRKKTGIHKRQGARYDYNEVSEE